MNMIYSIVIEYDFSDSFPQKTYFVSFDKDHVIEKAKKLTLQCSPEHVLFSRPSLDQYDRTEMKDDISRIFVTETPLGVEIGQTEYYRTNMDNTPKINIVWTSSIRLLESECFSENLINLFKFDLNITPTKSDIVEIRSLYLEQPQLFFTMTKEGRVTINAADIIKLLKPEHQYLEMMTIEEQLRK